MSQQKEANINLYGAFDIELSILAWINNHIHYKMWDEINHLFPIWTVQPLKFESE